MARSVKLDFFNFHEYWRASAIRPFMEYSAQHSITSTATGQGIWGVSYARAGIYIQRYVFFVFLYNCVSYLHLRFNHTFRTTYTTLHLACNLFWIFIFGIFFVFWVFFSVFVFHICICITQVPTAGLPGGGKHLACNLISDLLVTHTHPPHHSWLVLGQSFLLRLNEHSMMQILIGCFRCRLWWVWITFNPCLENNTNITSLFV